MKRLLLFVFVLTTFGLRAQSYKSLCTNEKSSNWNFFSNTIPGNTIKYFIDEDTIINSLTYKWFGKGTTESGLIREDTVLGKIWFKGVNPYTHLITDTSEKLVCDFSLNVNDSFHYYYHQPYGLNKYFDGDIWLKVDSVFNFRGLKHIRFDTAGCSNLIYYHSNNSKKTIVKFVMIEGFGTNRGFHYMFNILNNWVVQCQYRDLDLFYSNTYSSYPDSCNLSLGVGLGESVFNDFSISPNPSNNIIKITGKMVSLEFNYEIYDLRGNIIQLGKSNGSSELEIDISKFDSGIQIIRINSGNSVIVKKIMKF